MKFRHLALAALLVAPLAGAQSGWEEVSGITGLLRKLDATANADQLMLYVTYRNVGTAPIKFHFQLMCEPQNPPFCGSPEYTEKLAPGERSDQVRFQVIRSECGGKLDVCNVTTRVAY